jgi:inosine/xanthosine triphosphate pyrophosphatase family protein
MTDESKPNKTTKADEQPALTDDMALAVAALGGGPATDASETPVNDDDRLDGRSKDEQPRPPGRWSEAA